MTTEEMAIAIQQGNKNLINSLWEQTQRFLYMLAAHCYTTHEEQARRCGTTPEDFKQIAFFALLDMIKAYNPQKGFSFIAYAGFAYRNRAKELLQGYTRNSDPLNHCESLDAPITAEAEETRAALIFDPASEECFEHIFDLEWQRDLRQAEEAALDMIDRERALVLRKEFFNDESIAAISENLHITEQRVRHLKREGLRNLRRGKPALLLMPFCNQTYHSLGLKRIGLTAFVSGGSSTERAVEKLDYWRERD